MSLTGTHNLLSFKDHFVASNIHDTTIIRHKGKEVRTRGRMVGQGEGS